MYDTAARRPPAIKAHPVSITGKDTLKTRRTLTVDGSQYDYFSIEAAQAEIGDVSRLPFSMKVLLENLLRFEDGRSVTKEDIMGFVTWLANKGKGDIGGDHAQLADESHGNAPLVHVTARNNAKT